MKAWLWLLACGGGPTPPLVVVAPDSLADPLAAASLPWGIAHAQVALVQVYEPSAEVLDRFARAGAAQVLVGTDPALMDSAVAAGLVVDPQPLGAGPLWVALSPDATDHARSYVAHLQGTPSLATALSGP